MSGCRSSKVGQGITAVLLAMTLSVAASAFRPTPSPIGDPGVSVERANPGGGGTGGGTGGPPEGQKVRVFP